MRMEIRYNEEINLENWEQFIKENAKSSPFQSVEYINIAKDSEQIETYQFCGLFDDRIAIACLVTIQNESGIKSFFSKRAIIYSGFVDDNISDNNLSDFLKFIYIKLKSKVIYIETRNFFDYANHRLIFEKNNWEYLPYLNFILAIKNKSLLDILSAMKYNRRREIKMSQKEGATYSFATNELEIEELYNILKDLYVTRVKVPLPKLSFFKAIYNSKFGKVFIVKHNEKVIGGAFCLFYPSNNLYTLYYCSIRDYNKKIFATHLAIIAAIEFGIENNINAIDFMGAGKPNEEYGVRKYKAEFGGELVEHGRFILVTKPKLYVLGKFALKLIQKIKK